MFFKNIFLKGDLWRYFPARKKPYIPDMRRRKWFVSFLSLGKKYAHFRVTLTQGVAISLIAKSKSALPRKEKNRGKKRKTSWEFPNGSSIGAAERDAGGLWHSFPIRKTTTLPFLSHILTKRIRFFWSAGRSMQHPIFHSHSHRQIQIEFVEL